MTPTPESALAVLFWLPYAAYLVYRVLFTEPGQMNDEGYYDE